jgi:hypothetical protein
VWPAKCDRCKEKNLPCSPPEPKTKEKRPFQSAEVSPFIQPKQIQRQIENASTVRWSYKHSQANIDPNSPYQHPRTDRSQIRILQLFPANRDEPLTATIIVQQPQEHQYEALSYVWGPPEHKASIIIDGHYVSITDNLHAALYHLRFSSYPRHLWVDALCINQEDSRDKIHFLARMGQIYSQAAQVCIWIGHESPTSTLALSAIRDCVNNLEVSDRFSQEYNVNTGGLQHPLSSQDGIDPARNAILELMQRPWFSRLWVIQEIAMAKKATLHCGRDSMAWQDFEDAVAILESIDIKSRQQKLLVNHGALDYGFRARDAGRLVNILSYVVRKYEDGRVAERLMPLEDLVSGEFQHFKCTDGRDRVYAVLGLAKDAWAVTIKDEWDQYSGSRDGKQYFVDWSLAKVNTWWDPKLVPSTLEYGYVIKVLPVVERWQRLLAIRKWAKGSPGRPQRQPLLKSEQLEKLLPALRVWKKRLASRKFVLDHQQDLVGICKQLVAFVISKSASLDIICRPWAPITFEKGFPTWIRTLVEAPFGRRVDSSHGRLNADPFVGAPEERFYNASNSTTVSFTKFRESDNYSSLYVEGFILDTIIEKGDTALGGIIPWDWMELGGYQETSEEAPEELWRVLVANRGPRGTSPPPYYRRAFQYALKQTVISGDLNTQELISSTGSQLVRDFLLRVQSVVWTRRMIRTRDRNLLGLAPKKSKKQDL